MNNCNAKMLNAQPPKYLRCGCCLDQGACNTRRRENRRWRRELRDGDYD